LAFGDGNATVANYNIKRLPEDTGIVKALALQYGLGAVSLGTRLTGHQRRWSGREPGTKAKQGEERMRRVPPSWTRLAWIRLEVLSFSTYRRL
jgi:hypothetical protein